MRISCIIAGVVFFFPGQAFSQGVLTRPQAPTIELLESTSAPNSQFEEMKHKCFGFNLIAEIESYEAPDITRAVTESFNSIDELQRAIDSTDDHSGAVFKLESGTYTFGSTGLRITNKKNLTLFSDPMNRAVLDGQDQSNFGIQITETISSGTANIEVIGFEVTRTRFHGIFLGSDSTGVRAGSEIFIGDNLIQNAANLKGAGITIRNATGKDRIIIEHNEITEIDMDGTGSARGEGIYVGQGSNKDHYGDNVIIRGNYIHNLNGEAIDVKRNSRNILIENNIINDINVFSQGAITLGIDNLRIQDFEAKSVVKNNVISNVRSLAKDGNAIVVGYDTEIVGNLIFNIAKHAIDVYDDATGPNADVSIFNNIIWNYVGSPIRENVGTGNGGGHNPFFITRSKNIVESQAASSDCLVQSKEFAGPLDNIRGFSPIN